VKLDRKEWQDRAVELESLGHDALPGDPACYEGPLRCGSRVAFRVVRSRPGRPEDRWEIVLTAPDSPRSIAGTLTGEGSLTGAESTFDMSCRATVFEGELLIKDGDGGEERSVLQLPLGMLAMGIGGSCDILERKDSGKEPKDGDHRLLSRSLLASLAMSTMANNSKAAFKIAFELIQFPSWWSWIVPTLNINMQPDLAGAVRVNTPIGPGWRVPLEILIKGDPGFYTTVTAVEPRGVLNMSAGIIEAVGFAPDRPDHEVRVTLIDARFAEPDTPGSPIRGEVIWE